MPQANDCHCKLSHQDQIEKIRENMAPKEEYLALAALFKLFGDGTRVQILHALEQGEMCVDHIAALLGLTKSAVSHQLKALRLANLVTFRREAQNVYYSLADAHVQKILDMGFDHLHE